MQSADTTCGSVSCHVLIVIERVALLIRAIIAGWRSFPYRVATVWSWFVK